MAGLMNIIGLVVITLFTPLIVLVGLNLFEKKDYAKICKIVALVFFFVEVVRFFVQPHFYAEKLGKIPSDDLKFGFITFMSIFGLFAAFMGGKVGDIFKKVFALLSLTVFVIGVFEERVYTLSYDKYALIKGLYFIGSGLSVLLGILFLLEGVEVKTFDLIIAVLICLAFFGLSIFYIKYWNLSIEKNLIYYLGKGVMTLSTVMVFFIAKIDKLWKRS